jgi:hypothetical protein
MDLIQQRADDAEQLEQFRRGQTLLEQTVRALHEENHLAESEYTDRM